MNWKYEKWKNSAVSEYEDIQTYIEMEIYPEDIELFSYILLPSTILYKDRVIIVDIEKNNDYIKNSMKSFDDWDSSHGGKTAQWMINKTLISNIFCNSIEPETSGSTLIRIAELIKYNWEFFLSKNYPNKEFIIEIGDIEWEDPYVTFYQP